MWRKDCPRRPRRGASDQYSARALQRTACGAATRCCYLCWRTGHSGTWTSYRVGFGSQCCAPECWRWHPVVNGRPSSWRTENMTDLKSPVQVVLQDAGYETWLMSVDDLPSIGFEDNAVMGFVCLF